MRQFPRSSASCVHRVLLSGGSPPGPHLAPGGLCPTPPGPTRSHALSPVSAAFPSSRVPSGSPSTQPSAFPHPTLGWNISPLRALSCFILRGSHVVVFKVDPLPSLGFREEQSQCVHTQVCKLSENQAVWCIPGRRTQQIPQAGGNTRATTQGLQRRCRQDSCMTRGAVGMG